MKWVYIKIELLIALGLYMYCLREFVMFLCLHALLLNKELHILFYAVGLNYGVCRNVVVFFLTSVVMNNKREHVPGSGDTPGKPGNKMHKKTPRSRHL